MFASVAEAQVNKNVMLHRQKNKTQQRNTSIEKLAINYYRNGEFEKAMPLFEQLYNTNNAHYYYNYYLNCLLKLNLYKDAEKLAKKQAKRTGGVRYMVDQAYVYDLEGDKKKSISILDKISRKLPENRNDIRQIANALQMRGYYGTAKQVYEKASKDNRALYSLELANAYQLTGEYDKMIDSYLLHLKDHPDDRQMVKNRLQTLLRFDVNQSLSKVLKDKLLLKIRQYPDEELYPEFLFWYSMQTEDFEMAYLQATAIDRRFQDAGEEILKLAEICISNKQYEIAAKTYKYLMDKEKNGPFYIECSNGYYVSIVQKELENNTLEKKTWKKLRKKGIETLEDIGINVQTSEVSRLLAYITAFKLGDYAEATNILEKALSIRYNNLEDKSKLKLLLADILVLQDKIWDASLLYSQIEGDMKNETIGHEAKFRNAKLFYYSGEFQWSLTRLDVLKSASSKLIANDAIELSIFITSILENDTMGFDLRKFAAADLYLYRNQYDSAVIFLNKILKSAYSPKSAEYATYKLANVYALSGKFETADSLYNEMINKYPNSVKTDNAIFEQAEMNRTKLNNPDKALALYLKLMKDFSDSIYSGEARVKYRQLQNKLKEDL